MNKIIAMADRFYELFVLAVLAGGVCAAVMLWVDGAPRRAEKRRLRKLRIEKETWRRS